MRVALDVSAVPPKVAGAGRYIVELATRLPENDVRTTLVTRRDDSDRWPRLSPRSSVSAVVPNARGRRLAYEAWWLGRGEAATAADLWHGPHYTMPRRRLRPTVVTIHDLTFFTNPEWHERSKVAFFRRAIRYSAINARVLISVSDFTARLLDEVIPDHAPVVVAPLGVDLERFSDAREGDDALVTAHGLPVSTPFVFFVGTAEPRKGLDVLLSAFEEVARRDDTVELWLAGQSGWGVAGLEAQLSRHPFRSRIRRLGFVDDDVLPALYRRAGAVVYPSRGEGFGLPVLEAMACGATTITTQGTVMAEVAGDAARLVPGGEPDALAAAILEVLVAGDDDRALVASRARRRAEGYTWQRCVQVHRRAYELALK